MLLVRACIQFDPDSMKTAEFDWWSKYYCSINDPIRKQKKYEDTGYDKIVVMQCCGIEGVKSLVTMVITLGL